MTYVNAYDCIRTPTVLLADNDDAQRLHIADFLRRRGYGVLEAKTSLEALLLSVDYPFPLVALFTSLSLRKYCNGSELAACLQAIRPGMAVVYLGDMRDAGDEAVRNIVSGEAILLGRPHRGSVVRRDGNSGSGDRRWQDADPPRNVRGATRPDP
jgi:CheY-like chemotaxis protein